MIKTGQSIFGNNIIQTILIVASLGLAIIAQRLSVDLSNIPISKFISVSVGNIFAENETFNLWVNVVIPFVLYIITCLSLLWMGITNFSTFRFENSVTDASLRFVLGVTQIILFAWFAFVRGKLFVYYAAFSLFLIVCVALLAFAF